MKQRPGAILGPLDLIEVDAVAALSLRGAFSRRLRRLLLASAAGEMVVDKIPNAPSRLGAPALAARKTSGATAGSS